MFDHEGPAMICKMHNITVRVFKHIEIISEIDVDKMIKYTEHILRGAVLNKYRKVLTE